MRTFLVSLLLLPMLAVVLSIPSPCEEVKDKTGNDKQGDQRELPENIACDLDKEQKDLTTWPNCQSSGNSDPWIFTNHDKIRKMRPRVLVMNFANNVDMEGVKDRTERIIKALTEATRYHGYKNAQAPAFLEYQALKYIDMRDRPVPDERKDRNSAFCPYVQEGAAGPCDYGAFYGDVFARFYGFQDTKDYRRYLDLDELINRGIVHELWFYQIHDDRGAPLETIEYKQYYDEQCRPIPGKHGPAGNGHSDTMPWSGRSFRITFFNPHRGIGCGMENFGHALEGMANYNSIAYYRKYLNEYAEFDLDKRYGLPFNSLYAIGGEQEKVEYPTSGSMVITRQGKKHKVERYCATAGNVHFPPGARGHYDLESPFTVKSTIENYRLRNGAGGKDKVDDFNKGKFARWRDFCPDGMGPWLVFWRQNMPGLDNKCVDDDGKPMKNWWPFLFY